MTTKKELVNGLRDGTHILLGGRTEEFYDFCDWIEPDLGLNHSTAWYSASKIYSFADYCRKYQRNEVNLVFLKRTLAGPMLDGFGLTFDLYKHSTTIQGDKIIFRSSGKEYIVVDWNDVTDAPTTIDFESLL